MNRKEMIALLQAEEEGKQVQARWKGEGKIWCDYTLFHEGSACITPKDMEYRIKPEPLKCWANVFKDSTLISAYSSKERALRVVENQKHAYERIAVPMIEVEE